MAAEPETGSRERAVTRLKQRSEFAHNLVAYALVNGLLVVIWALTRVMDSSGRRSPWPDGIPA